MYKSNDINPETAEAISTAQTYFAMTNDGNTIHIKNHLGEFDFAAANALRFENGLVGFQELREFGLANLPYENMDQFKLLQSLEVPELSFIVMPMAPETSHLQPDEVNEICQTFGVEKRNLALLFIVTIRQLADTIKITKNARAPIILDTAKRTGRQFILPNQNYSVQQEL